MMAELNLSAYNFYFNAFSAFCLSTFCCGRYLQEQEQLRHAVCNNRSHQNTVTVKNGI